MAILQKPIVLSEADVQRFWSKVEIREQDQCWLWIAKANSKGYGSFKSKGTMYYATRIAYFLANGHIPEGSLICHRCDNPACCNPRHLFAGSYKDNAVDMCSKGRGRCNRQNGELNTSAKLTTEIVKEARRIYRKGGVSIREVSEMLNVNIGTMSDAIRGETWKHITSELE